MFGAAWFVAFIAPVLPLAARSELYLYLAGFGLCLIAGGIARTVWQSQAMARAVTAIVTYVVLLASYQTFRASAGHKVAAFSAAFTEALQREPRITSHSGVIVIVPADPVTERWLESSVGGYVDVALRRIVKRDDIGATVRYTGRPVVLDGLHVRCTYRDGQVVLSLAP